MEQDDKILKRKIAKDDVILLRKDLLPKKVMPFDFYSDIECNKDTTYDVIGITWENYPDRTRLIAYILKNDKECLTVRPAIHFKIVEVVGDEK